MPSEEALQAGRKLGLTDVQMASHNFGFHTVSAIHDLQRLETGLTVEAAYERVQGLDVRQAEGVGLGLTREQMLSATHLSMFTFFRIKDLMDRGADLQAAYLVVQGLNEDQLEGIGAGLSRDEVTDAHYTSGKLNVARYLIQTNPSLNIHTAYASVVDLAQDEVSKRLAAIEARRSGYAGASLTTRVDLGRASTTAPIPPPQIQSPLSAMMFVALMVAAAAAVRRGPDDWDQENLEDPSWGLEDPKAVQWDPPFPGLE